LPNSDSITSNDNSIKCECCNSSKIKDLFLNSFFKKKVKECEDCGYKFTQISNADLNSFLHDYYKDRYWKWTNRKDNYLEKKIKQISWLGLDSIRANSQYEFLKNYSGKVLDIGAGKGDLSRIFSKKGYDVTIIEPAEENTNKLKKTLSDVQIITGEFETIDIKEKFDIIIMSHILEHVKDMINFLKSAKKLLSPDGIIFIEVPDCNNKIILENSVGENPHISHFSRQSLENLLMKLNFEIKKFDTVFFEIKGSTKSLRGIKFLKYQFFKKNTYTTCHDDEIGDAFRIIITTKKA